MKILFKNITDPKFIEAFRKFCSLEIDVDNLVESLKFSRLSQKIKQEQDIYLKKVNEAKKLVQETHASSTEVQRKLIENNLTLSILELSESESELEPLFSHKILKKEMKLTREDLQFLLPIFNDLPE